MKVQTREKRVTEFIDVMVGEAFMFEGDLYIKTPTLEITTGIEKDHVNAVDVRSGIVEYFENVAKVFLVDAEVVLK